MQMLYMDKYKTGLGQSGFTVKQLPWLFPFCNITQSVCCQFFYTVSGSLESVLLFVEMLRWYVSHWRVWVHLRRLSKDCWKDRCALASSRVPSSSTFSVILLQIKRASWWCPGRPFSHSRVLNVPRWWGNSSMARDTRWVGKVLSWVISNEAIDPRLVEVTVKPYRFFRC